MTVVADRDPKTPRANVVARIGRVVTYVWILAIATAGVQWIRDPSVFTQEAMADVMQAWGPWAFGTFVAVSLIRGFFLIPSTPIILAGGMLFPESPAAVFLVSMVGIVVSATLIYLMPGLGGYHDLLERKYPEKIVRVRTHLVKPYSFWIVFGWSFFPLVPTDVICYAAGLVQMSYRRMILALILGELPLVAGYVFITQGVHGLLG